MWCCWLPPHPTPIPPKTVTIADWSLTFPEAELAVRARAGGEVQPLTTVAVSCHLAVTEGDNLCSCVSFGPTHSAVQALVLCHSATNHTVGRVKASTLHHSMKIVYTISTSHSEIVYCIHTAKHTISMVTSYHTLIVKHTLPMLIHNTAMIKHTILPQ